MGCALTALTRGADFSLSRVAFPLVRTKDAKNFSDAYGVFAFPSLSFHCTSGLFVFLGGAAVRCPERL